MKINWFSPLPPAKTDIAHYTTRVLPELARVSEVTVWTDQAKWEPDLARLFDVRRFRADRAPLSELNVADINIYNIGNNPDFHGGIWEVSRLVSGVVVLHDFRLHHFFDGIFRVKHRDLHSYLAVMERYYGERGRLAAMYCFQNDAKNIDEMAERYPLTEFAFANALGAVVHTAEAFASLVEKAFCPVAYAPLPFPNRTLTRVSRNKEAQYRLIVFGYIGRNRRLESILRALAQSEYKDRYQLDVFGSILNDERQLRGLINSLGLSNRVTLHGFKTEAELDEALSQADLAINLRHPTMGEASGSQLRIWAHGLPSLVSKVGWYASLPAETVSFVRTDEHEVEDIQAHLRAFADNPELFAEMGERGRRVLEQKHSPKEYTEAVLELAQAAMAFRPRLAGLELAQRAAHLATDCFSPNLIDESFHRVAAEVHDMVEGH